jgi:two-component system response regulator RegA
MSVDKTPQQLLLVEDDEVFARVLSKALGRRGYEVRYAPDLSLAFQLVEQEQFDLAILDLNLGGATSMELIKPLKQSNPEIRMLILTGYASIATAVEAIKLGADNYLAKPADTDEILASLLNREQLDKQVADSDGGLATMSVKRLEWEHIQKTLQANNGNISATARQLNMHRRTLQRKLQKRPVRT